MSELKQTNKPSNQTDTAGCHPYNIPCAGMTVGEQGRNQQAGLYPTRLQSNFNVLETKINSSKINEHFLCLKSATEHDFRGLQSKKDKRKKKKKDGQKEVKKKL